MQAETGAPGPSAAAASVPVPDRARTAVFRRDADALAQLLPQLSWAACTDAFGKSVLHWAAARGWTDAVRQILDAGCPVDVRDSTNATALFFAAFNGHVEVATLLLDRGADILRRNVDGDTALHYASAMSRTLLVKALLAHPRVDQSRRELAMLSRNRQGDTPLHTAASFNSYQVAKVLLEAGASKEVTNAQGKVALEVAQDLARTMDKEPGPPEVLEVLGQRPRARSSRAAPAAAASNLPL